ncbi:sensor histidine kinase, partial [Nocardia sp. NPDC058633]|uniref:sensor histidine kinase n=1 Tax=Nocardia sp. NPDC058633 TaxID=3346568 RepID=UPI00364CD26C
VQLSAATTDHVPKLGANDLATPVHTPPPGDGAISGSRPFAAISSAALAQILDVALSNSCRYAGSGAHTVVSVTAEPDGVTIRVADDGTGVPPDELDKLTARFFRGTTAVSGGTGLGLSIAQALAKARGGALTVEATRPHGLAVAVRVPAVTR